MSNFFHLLEYIFSVDKTMPSTQKWKGVHIGFSEAKAASMSTSLMLALINSLPTSVVSC